MLLDIQRKFFSRSERVKAVDFHPTEPWLLVGLYNGSVHIWNYETGASVKTFEVADVPVRCVRFIARKNWFLAGSDDYYLRCYNYNTQEKVAAFEAHPDYVRSIAVHATHPYVLTGGDDMTIKLWDWDRDWRLMQTFEGHTHFVMHLSFNPKDANSFASASLDRTVKVWTLGAGTANFTLDAHEKGVNYVEYYHGSDKPYMITTGDDRTIKIWDYLSKSCVQTLTGHTSIVSFAIFHPSLPLIISGSEDGTVKLWHANTYRLESTLDYGLERAWCIAYQKNKNDIALGYDEGSVVVKLGKEEPSMSMDSSGKVVWARNAEVLSTNLAQLSESELTDGERLRVQTREMGSTEIFPQLLQHSPNGRFVTVCGDGEYTIYTALAWRNKAFGSATGFAWAADSNTYAIRENSQTRVRLFKNFKEQSGLVLINYQVEGIAGGALLAVIGVGFVCFYDWNSGALVRRINVEARQVIWSQTNTLVTIVTDDSYYVLRFEREAYDAYLASGMPLDQDGFEEAFDVVAEIPEAVRTGKWTGECFVYINKANRMQYYIGEQSYSIRPLDQELYVLGYLPQLNRVFAADKDMNICSFALSLSVIEYQTAILQGDMQHASELLSSITPQQRSKVAKFLEAQNMLELALEVAVDQDHRFDLALALDKFDVALDIARTAPSSGSEIRWRTIGDRALARWNVMLAQECFENANDVQSLFLIASAQKNRRLLQHVAQQAQAQGQFNIAFSAFLQIQDVDACLSLLVDTKRYAEAATFARTYAPQRVQEMVMQWKHSLASEPSAKQKQLSDRIADPQSNPELFEGENLS
ncbi:Coatomer subunit beta' [Malassezia psittaci]|uniref:Coatomer subunit beta' n=1 Tax=Malassezia psittaci TaxID=1821823 RepID=A0AAF0F8X2_9BASI|nr:Coatomer subunit beta' [Malassezia psittaci]